MILAYLFYLLSNFIYSHSDRLQQHTIDSMEKSSQSLQEYADQNGLYYADYETIRSWQKQTDTSIYFYGSKEELQRSEES